MRRAVSVVVVDMLGSLVWWERNGRFAGVFESVVVYHVLSLVKDKALLVRCLCARLC